jgi:hypothetical protein
MLPLLLGILFALAVGVFGTRIGMDRDRAFYPTIMIVIAFLYVLFAVMGGSTHALTLELIVCAAFATAATVGFKKSLWIVVAALAGHGLMDLVHGRFISNPGVPSWWPGWCGAYDVAAAAYLAWLLKSGRLRAAA